MFRSVFELRSEASLDLSPIGNCSVSALIDRSGRFVWACAPRVDGDPLFSSLLGGDEGQRGVWSIELADQAHVRQSYERNTPIVRTLLSDQSGNEAEIIDFCPRYRRHNRVYRPLAFVRIVRPLKGAPRVRVRVTPTADWGARLADRTFGSNHIRYLCTGATLRLSTTAPVSLLRTERVFRLEEEHVFFLGPDEPFEGDIRAVVAGMYDNTRRYWQEWVRTLATPLEWQDAVIRAAIALKLCVYEETGAIVAALTTSIPEAPNSGRNWDYRYCWLRDAYYTIQALNRLGAMDVLEGYLAYLRNIIDASPDGRIQPLYGVDLEPVLAECIVDSVPGYRGMGPVRLGNEAHTQAQHDVYGQIVLSTVQAFFDARLIRQPKLEDFLALEKVGEIAHTIYAQPDAGLWEFRTRAAAHTYSVLMCWAACDRLANAAARLDLSDKEALWRSRAQEIHTFITQHAWNGDLERFTATLNGVEMDASLMQLAEVRFIDPKDERFLSTLNAIERELRHGDHVMRYVAEDDFGPPETAFNFCTFWFIEALALTGRRQEARALFDRMLARRSDAGLLSEDCELRSGELWGNYPQTYSLAGLINCAVLLSDPWSTVR